MKTIFLSFPLLFHFYFSFAQNDVSKITDSITIEGKLLYKSEMASWYGTDIFLEKYTDRKNIGGYFSYVDNLISKCVFFSKSENPKVIGTMSFDDSFEVNKAQIDLTEREFTNSELELYKIRFAALNLINEDSLFKFYKNTNLNLIPIISNSEKKVYVLTGPKENGIVIFGNDYLIKFDDDNNIISKKDLHRNIITIKYGEVTQNGDSIVGAIHNHLPETGDFMTATDICTLMLYSKFAKWEQYTVVSQNYFNFWNCRTNELTAITRKVIEKINSDQEKRKKKD